MNRFYLLAISLIFLLFACSSSNINTEHEYFFEELGWSIKSIESEESYTLELSPETIESYQASNILFLEEYIGKDLEETKYILNEKDPEGENIIAYVYEFNGEIIGGLGIFPSATPGVFNLADKQSEASSQ